MTLETAIVNAKAGGYKILLRSDNVIRTLSTDIKIDGTLTLAPDEDYHPILVQEQPADDNNFPVDAALFRLTSGRCSWNTSSFR